MLAYDLDAVVVLLRRADDRRQASKEAESLGSIGDTLPGSIAQPARRPHLDNADQMLYIVRPGCSFPAKEVS
jgi:hypothetical protein